MADPQWKDVTSYARGEERVPRTLELDLDELTIIVTRQHGLPGWFMRCRELDMGCGIAIELGSEGVIEAQGEALRRVSREVHTMARAIDPAWARFAVCNYEDCDQSPTHEVKGGLRMCEYHAKGGT